MLKIFRLHGQAVMNGQQEKLCRATVPNGPFHFALEQVEGNCSQRQLKEAYMDMTVLSRLRSPMLPLLA